MTAPKKRRSRRPIGAEAPVKIQLRLMTVERLTAPGATAKAIEDAKSCPVIVVHGRKLVAVIYAVPDGMTMEAVYRATKTDLWQQGERRRAKR